MTFVCALKTASLLSRNFISTSMGATGKPPPLACNFNRDKLYTLWTGRVKLDAHSPCGHQQQHAFQTTDKQTNRWTSLVLRGGGFKSYRASMVSHRTRDGWVETWVFENHCGKLLTPRDRSTSHSEQYNLLIDKQVALLSQRGRAMLRVCIASIQNVERSLVLLVVSASDIQLRTIKFFFCSLLFGVFVHAAGRHKQTFDGRWCVADCAIYTAWSSVTVFCHFVVSLVSLKFIVHVVRTSSNLR